jgi:hypothetical protein
VGSDSLSASTTTTVNENIFTGSVTETDATTMSMGASKPASYGRFKTSQGLDVHGPLFFPSQD